MPTFPTNPDPSTGSGHSPPDELNLSDACLLALHHSGWIGGLRRKDAPDAPDLRSKRKYRRDRLIVRKS